MGLLDDARQFLSREAGQKRRAWLDGLLNDGGETLDYYLGPTGIPDKLKGVAGLLDFTDAGDYTAAADASRNVWNNPTLGNAAEFTAAGIALGLPMYSARLGQGIADTAEEMVRAYDPSMVRSAGPTGRGTGIPNLRNMTTEQAIRTAKKEPHLIKSGEAAEGAYVGGPRNIKSKRGLTAQRKRMDAGVDAGAEGGDWYDRYRAGVTEVTENERDATWMANAEGQYSAGVSPEGELGFTLKDNNSAIAYGLPVKAARPAQQEGTIRAIEANDPSQYMLGQKTGEYASRINPSAAARANATGVNDFRHARTLGYTNADGTPSDGQIGIAGHRFADYETALMVERANKRRLAGRTDWTGEQIQAAPWVAQKADDLFGRNSKRYREEAANILRRTSNDPNPSPEAIEAAARRIAFEDANRTIADYFPKHEAYATYEAQPFVDAGHLPGSASASEAERMAYYSEPGSAWSIAPGGRDAIYSGMRLGDTGIAMRVRPTTEMQGIYTPPSGALETNPGAVARPLVAFDNTSAGKVTAEADRGLLDLGEATRAYVDVQGAGAWHKPWPAKKISEVSGVSVPAAERPRSLGEIQALQEVGRKYGVPDVVDTGNGVTLTNFEGAGKPLGKKQMAALNNEIFALSNEYGVARPMNVDSGYLGYEDAWRAGEGSGEATRGLLDVVDRSPGGAVEAMDNNPYLAQAALDRIARDKKWSKKWGATRKDIENARRIIGDGPGWVGRLRDALQKGAVLPAIGTLVFGSYQQEDER